MSRKLAASAIAGAIGLLVLISAASANDVAKGRALAERLCASCHMQPGQGEKHGAMGLPGFGAIASRPGQSHEAIVRWLRSRPTMMPDHQLTWDEADAITEFIMSLRGTK